MFGSRRIRALSAGGAALAVVVTGLTVGPGLAAQEDSADGGSNGPRQQRERQQVQQEAYDWQNVEIGGGGFVPGIVFNESEPDLIYARTDIGGAYRWNPNNERWIPLLDHIGWDNWGYNGVHSLATDPVDPDRVYAAVGMYTNDWDPNNGAILASKDRGDTWQEFELPFKLGGNMPGRGMGERLAVNPHDNSEVYFGAPEGNGLWRSRDSGESWSKVQSFPNPGDYAQDPDDETGYLSHQPGVIWVTFDPNREGHVYVGVADLENSIYHSTDGGQSWERVAGQPEGYLPHKGVFGSSGNGQDFLYIATSNTGGPYDGEEGEVWRYNVSNGNWVEITPVTGEDRYYGYSGLTVDRQQPGTLVVATQISWWPDVIFFRSTDNGQTWSPIWEYTNYPERKNRYTMDISSVPWLDFGVQNPAPPEQTPKLGWMTESVQIDPHDSDRMLYGTGATIYATDQLTNWDRDETFTVSPMIRGLEETAVLDLAAPAEGAPLISGLGDLGGFVHQDLEEIPQSIFTSPTFTTTTSLDVAEQDPSVVVRVGNLDEEDPGNATHIAFSTDGGESWQPGQEPGSVEAGGTVAAAADGSGFVWAPEGSGVVHTNGVGGSWTASEGIPAGAAVASDRVDPNVFYGLADGTFYRSEDGGASFTAVTRNLPESARFAAVPGRSGHLWLTADDGMHRSTNGGDGFRKVNGVASARNIGFGAPAPDSDYPALYAVATVDGMEGVFRSDDEGASWVRINDDAHQFGNMGEAITGDPNVYGRVYLGTNGRGILYADPSGDPSGDQGRGQDERRTP